MNKMLDQIRKQCPCCTYSCVIADIPSDHYLSDPYVLHSLIHCFAHYSCGGKIRLIDTTGKYEWTTHCPNMWELLQAEWNASAEKRVVCCEDCGLAYGSEQWVEAVVPNDIWNIIYPGSSGGGILCIGCISRRCRNHMLENVPVMLTGNEALRAANEDEVFQRGFMCQEKQQKEKEIEYNTKIKALETELAGTKNKILELQNTVNSMLKKPSPPTRVRSEIYLDTASKHPAEDVYFD